MKAIIHITKKEVRQIDSHTKISSGDLKKAFGLKGEIITISLYSGRNPNDEEKGVLADKDIWEIHTKQIIKCEAKK